MARFGEKLCPMCQKEAAIQELIAENTKVKYLDSMLSEAVVSLESLCAILDTEEHDRVRDVLKPLVERLDAELQKIGDIIISTLGNIQIWVCPDPMRIGDKWYRKGDFVKAVLEPKEARGPVC
jgi:hypothetical protein